MVLIAANYPLGWGGVIAGMVLYRKTRCKLWCLAGTGVYGLSWVMLACGIWLAGPEGVAMAKKGGWPLPVLVVAAAAAGAAVYRQVRANRTETARRHAELLREEMRIGLEPLHVPGIVRITVMPGLTIPPGKSYNNENLILAEPTGKSDEFTDTDPGAAVFGDTARSSARLDG